MSFTIPDFTIVIPEIFLLAMVCVALLANVFISKEIRARSIFIIAQVALVGSIFLVIARYHNFVQPIITMSGGFILDWLAILTQLFVLITTMFAFVYARSDQSACKKNVSEYYILGLFAVIGMLVMASAASFLLAWLGLELLSLSMYAMTALDKKSTKSIEAAMKYFVMGGMASGIMLYGISLVYGVTGSIEFTVIDAFLQHSSAAGLGIAVLGMVFIVVGLLFKFGAVPFHMWVPDVYDGAPTSMTLFIACAPKIATFCIAMRILGGALLVNSPEWQEFLIVAAVLSMFAGNLMAIAQTSMKRLLAYSSIAHMGYVLLGVIAGPIAPLGYSAAMFYMVTYVIVAAGAFAVIALLSHDGQTFYKLDDFRGLNARHPWLAFLMLILMFSMAGIPPTVGFFAKLGLLESLVQAHMVWLAALALLFAIIGAYYYLRVIMYMYFEEPTAELMHVKVQLSRSSMAALTINSFAALALGIFPSALINLCRVSLY